MTDYPPEGNPPMTPEQIKARLEEASAWYDTIEEFTDLEGFKGWALKRLEQLEELWKAAQ